MRRRRFDGDPRHRRAWHRNLDRGRGVRRGRRGRGRACPEDPWLARRKERPGRSPNELDRPPRGPLGPATGDDRHRPHARAVRGERLRHRVPRGFLGSHARGERGHGAHHRARKRALLIRVAELGGRSQRPGRGRLPRLTARSRRYRDYHLHRLPAVLRAGHLGIPGSRGFRDRRAGRGGLHALRRLVLCPHRS